MLYSRAPVPQFRPRTLVDLLERRAALTGQQSAFFWNDQPHSFEELWRGANRFAAFLLECGVERGDRVLIRLPNGPDFFEAFYGSLRAGATAVPVFPASGAEHIASLARLCGARLVVVASAGGDIPGMRSISVADGAQSDAHASFPEVAPADVAFLQYTSGSTGSPKGVRLTHEGLLTNIGQLIEGMAITPADCFVSWLPVFHDMGLIFMTMVPFYLGAKLVLLPTSLANANPWLSAIARHRGTVTAAPDFAYRLALRHVREPALYDLSSLRVALDAAEPVRLSTLEAFERTFRLRNVLIAGYGLAEATVGVSTWAPGTAPLVDGRGVVSVGRPFRDVEIQIIEDGEPLAAGQVGEIAVRSPANTRGYYSDESETARLFWRDGYIRTGDLGYLDEGGHLFVTGRLKNIIKHGGATIFPQEPEQIADRLGSIRRSAAVGIDSGGPEGEQLYVFAELSKHGGYAEPELRDASLDLVHAIHTQLGIRPGRVYMLKPHSIPLTPNGKTQHAALRELYVSGALRAQNAILFPNY
jgi:acyl-CoA synthetase (AMP-forming)/AMP-acid ligase II